MSENAFAKMSNAEKLLRLAAALLMLPISFVIILWGAYVSSTVWNWMMVPIFQARPISLAQALALACVVSCFTWNFARKSDLRDIMKEPKDGLVRSGMTLAAGIFFPTLILGISWIIKGYI